MKQDGQVGQLSQLGLNAYEAKAYAALLGKDSFTAPQVADLSGVPRQRIAEIQEHCREEILVLTKPPYAKPPQDNREGIATVKRKIRACSIYEESVLLDDETRRGVAAFLRHGEEARFVKKLPLKLVIV